MNKRKAFINSMLSFVVIGSLASTVPFLITSCNKKKVEQNKITLNDNSSFATIYDNNKIAELLSSNTPSLDFDTKDGMKNISKSDIKEIKFSNDNTLVNIPDNFMKDFTTFNTVLELPASCKTIGNNFMSGCTAYNQRIKLSSTIEKIGDYFMDSCAAYNQPLSIPRSTELIGNYFMKDCVAMNFIISMQDGLKKIGDYFMNGCTTFTQPIYFKDNLEIIGNNFLDGCTGFNSVITFQNRLTTIGESFLYNCSSYNRDITFPNSVTFIGQNFFYGMDKMVSTISFNSIRETVMLDNDLSFTNFGGQSASSDSTLTGIKLKGGYVVNIIPAYSSINLIEVPS
ncbi:MAG: hypothetical protein Ta2E_08650 [Mycoplasmoidaceae bacterium]|nr:MAG: hypothetical protein Ta2E_08650 [Mycoplasmoidaceae bacterium]